MSTVNSQRNDNPQLKMNWPHSKLDQPPAVRLLEGYILRQCERDDQASFLQLMSACGWDFPDDRLQYCHSRVLPGGWFVVTQTGSKTLVASAMSLHNYTGRSIYSGTLGWVGCLPEQRGRGLGAVVAAAATARLIAAGYREIELYTEDFRTAAIEIYFRLGYLPYLYSDAVTQLWRQVCERLGRPFTPSDWPQGDNAFPSS